MFLSSGCGVTGGGSDAAVVNDKQAVKNESLLDYRYKNSSGELISYMDTIYNLDRAKHTFPGTVITDLLVEHYGTSWCPSCATSQQEYHNQMQLANLNGYTWFYINYGVDASSEYDPGWADHSYQNIKDCAGSATDSNLKAQCAATLAFLIEKAHGEGSNMKPADFPHTRGNGDPNVVYNQPPKRQILYDGFIPSTNVQITTTENAGVVTVTLTDDGTFPEILGDAKVHILIAHNMSEVVVPQMIIDIGAYITPKMNQVIHYTAEVDYTATLNNPQTISLDLSTIYLPKLSWDFIDNVAYTAEVAKVFPSTNNSIVVIVQNESFFPISRIYQSIVAPIEFTGFVDKN